MTRAQAFEKGGLKLVMTLSKSDAGDPTQSNVLCSFTNATGAEFGGFVFQAAVPKFVQLSMKPPSGSSLPPGGSLTQLLSVKNTLLGQKALMFKMKIAYSTSGLAVEEQATATNFPLGY